MEQRLDATYLRPGLVERTIAMGIGAVGVGTGIFLAAWGISFLWRYTPPEIAVRIANPELHVAQDSPLKVTQDKPFVVEPPEPLKIDPPKVTISVEQPRQSVVNGVSKDAKTAAGDIITREVTVFSNVRHGPGAVVTGWSYSRRQRWHAYKTVLLLRCSQPRSFDQRVDIASNGIRLVDIDAGLGPGSGGSHRKVPVVAGMRTESTILGAHQECRLDKLNLTEICHFCGRHVGGEGTQNLLQNTGLGPRRAGLRNVPRGANLPCEENQSLDAE